MSSLPAAWGKALERRKSTRPKRMGLFGNFGSKNLGNGGSLEVILSFLQRERPNADIVCICRNPDDMHRSRAVAASHIVSPDFEGVWLNHLNRLLLKVPRRLFDVAKTYRKARRLDVLVIPGTGILDDFGERPSAMPYALLKWCLATRPSGSKIVFVSIGAGPIHNRASRWLMKTAARIAHCRSCRDTVSKDYITSIGIDTTDDPVVPDVAFKLPIPESKGGKKHENRPLMVGVGVTNYCGWDATSDAGEAHREVSR